MSIYTFSGDTLDNTYQRVLQIDPDNILRDGEGETRSVQIIGSLSANTFLSGQTDLYSIFAQAGSVGASTFIQPGANIFTAGTTSEPIISVVNSPSFSGITLSGTGISSRALSFSATTLSGATIFSGSTNLGNIFPPIGSTVRNITGVGNIFTGGTATNPTISITGFPVFDRVIMTATTAANMSRALFFSANTFSATSITLANGASMPFSTYDSSGRNRLFVDNTFQLGFQVSGGPIYFGAFNNPVGAAAGFSIPANVVMAFTTGRTVGVGGSGVYYATTRPGALLEVFSNNGDKPQLRVIVDASTYPQSADSFQIQIKTGSTFNTIVNVTSGGTFNVFSGNTFIRTLSSDTIMTSVLTGGTLYGDGSNLTGIGNAVTLSLSWKFDTSTVSGDPGNTQFRYDNSVLSAITNIYVNDTTLNGVDASVILNKIKSGSEIYIQQKDNVNSAAIFSVTANSIDNTGWFSIPVTHVSNVGGAVPQNNKGCLFILFNSPDTDSNTYVTGFTYNNSNVLKIQQNNSQPELSVVVNTMSGLTIDGALTATTISAATINLRTNVPINRILHTDAVADISGSNLYWVDTSGNYYIDIATYMQIGYLNGWHHINGAGGWPFRINQAYNNIYLNESGVTLYDAGVGNTGVTRINSLSTGGAAKMVIADATGILSTQTIPTGGSGGTTSLNPTYIAFGNSSSGLTGSSNFVYAPTTTESKFEFRNWVGVANYPTIYMLPSGTTASSLNYTLANDGPNTYLNAISGNIRLDIGGSPIALLNSTDSRFNVSLRALSLSATTISGSTIFAENIYRAGTNIFLGSPNGYGVLLENGGGHSIYSSDLKIYTGNLADPNLGVRIDSVGLRIGLNSTLNTSNTYGFEVQGRASVYALSATTISGSTIQSSSMTSTGTTRMVQADSGGTLSATREIISAWVIDSTVISLITDVSQWSAVGVYTGTTISGLYQGQEYYNDNYFFKAVADNTPIRMLRG